MSVCRNYIRNIYLGRSTNLRLTCKVTEDSTWIAGAANNSSGAMVLWSSTGDSVALGSSEVELYPIVVTMNEGI